MKRSLLYLFLILIIFCFIKCENKKLASNPVIPPQTTYYRISGFIKSDGNPVENIQVNLGDSVTMTNNSGFFEFNEISEGLYQINVNGFPYLLFVKDIEINKDTSVNINLTKEYDDYFPLKVGNKWIYDWDDWFGGSGYSGHYEGTVTWTILSSQIFPSYEEFHFQETIYNETLDQEITNTFNGKMYGTDSLEISLPLFLPYRITIQRYLLTSSPDSLELNGLVPAATVILEKDKGIVYRRWFNGNFNDIVVLTEFIPGF